MDTDAQPVASSPTPDPTPVDPIAAAVASGDQAAYREARRAERSGKATPVSTPAASTPAEPVAQVASTDASPAPASEPADPAKGKGVKARNAALDAEIQDLQEKLRLRAQLREQVASPPGSDASPAASSPAPGPLSVDLSKPPLSEADFFAAHPESAYGEHARYLARYDRAQERQEDARAHSQSRISSALEDIEQRAIAAYPDFDAKAAVAMATGATFSPAILDVLLDHPQAHDLAYALVSDPAKLASLNRLSPARAGMALAALLPTPTAAAVPAPTITTAPPPPTTLGRKPADPTDPIESAVASGDMSQFKAIRLREQLTQIGR